MKKNLLYPFFGTLLATFLFSCVRDTDFGQLDEVTATPIVELNLIYFDLSASDFYDSITETPRLTVTDTTEIRFLDDTSTQESLLKAEFSFLFTNTIPRFFETQFQFLSESNDTTYVSQTIVNEGGINEPVVTEFMDVVEGQDILDLTSANRVVISVTIPSADESLQGNLNLKSKTTYYLEIKERN